MPLRDGGAEAAALLAAQIADLTRFRQIVEAQRAVLRMEDAGLLESFGAEADGLVADISAREVQILAIRRAVQADTRNLPESQSIADLYASSERARVLAGTAALDFAHQMEAEAKSIAVKIAEAGRQLDQPLGGYGRTGNQGGPILVDRTG